MIPQFIDKVRDVIGQDGVGAVGSNWLSDTLRVVADQYNEPFRQQIALGIRCRR